MCLDVRPLKYFYEAFVDVKSVNWQSFEVTVHGYAVLYVNKEIL